MSGPILSLPNRCRRRLWVDAILIGCLFGVDAAAEDTNVPTAGDPGLVAPLSDAPRVAVAPDAAVTEHPLTPAIRLAEQSLQRLQTIQDYEATFVKRERVDGQLVEQTMHMKLREQPLSIYLKYGEPLAGQEVLFVEGRNKNRVLIHQGNGLASLVGTTASGQQDRRATRDDRQPVTHYGMRQRLHAVIAQWKTESLYGEIDIRFYPEAKLRGRSCQVIEASHPRPRRQFKFQRTRLYLDDRTRLPVRIEQHGFAKGPDRDAEIDELYEYVNLRINVGLTDEDFDKNNPDYGF